MVSCISSGLCGPAPRSPDPGFLFVNLWLHTIRGNRKKVTGFREILVRREIAPTSPEHGQHVQETGTQHLEGHLPVELCILGPSILAHSTCAGFFCDPAMQDADAEHGESLHWHRAHCNQDDLSLPDYSKVGYGLGSRIRRPCASDSERDLRSRVCACCVGLARMSAGRCANFRASCRIPNITGGRNASDPAFDCAAPA